ncbi:MAG: hybrid sensor histidine kinase/response regulator [Bacteroidetes bacterium GWB2_41_8]|nr:MAG: hybrid sensor histidine kinase/response regulator [Bacteroidetes bacterium GWB2_41_8]
MIFINIAFSLNVLAVKFYSINSLYGISNRVTNSICKDDNGFIWASSKTGILRLSDDDHRVYQLPYMTSGAIVVKLIYEQSKLIAYTNNGQIFLYNSIYDRFDLIVNLSKTFSNDQFDVYALLVDKSGDYWIALNLGLYKYSSGELSLVEEISKDRYSISWFDEQHLIIAKSEGIWSLDIQSLKSKCIYENRNVSPFLVSSLFYDKTQHKLWIGTFSRGLFCYNFNSATLTHILESSFPRQPILAIEANSESTILVGIDGQGVWELNKQNSQLLNVYKENVDDPNSLRGNGVYDIFYDPGKRVWICTISGGVSFYDLASPLVNQIVHHANDANSLVNNDVNGIIEDRDGKIWFATNNGISCWDVASDKWKNFYYNKLKQAQVFLTLCEDDQGRIWAGSYSSGIYVLDGKTGAELAHYSRDEKELSSVSNFIFDIFKDSQGDLWIGGINGKFICYQSKENKFKTYTEIPISSFAELSPNQILLGCSNNIKLLNKQTGDIKCFLPDYVVQDILVLGDIVWVCTSGEGLLEYNHREGSTKTYTTHEGLPSNFLNSIIYADSCLWVGTESGLCRFNPVDKTAFTFSSIFPLSGISYNKSALSRLKNGQLAWGTNSGAVLFAPQSIREISSEGKIFFQDLTISGRSIRETASLKLKTPVDSLQTISLKYSQNTISLELISIGMQSGSKFSWKLEGFDKDWSAPSGNGIVTYTNIPSGKFELKIKLYDSSLSNVIAERSIEIKLIPPFWRTGWFWIIIILILSGIIVLYFLYYINMLKQEHTEEKVRFFTNTAHDIRTSLTLIKAPVEELSNEKNLSESGKYYLNLATEQARQLTSVVTQLMDFQKVDIGKEHLLLSMTDIVKLVSNRKIMLDSYAKSKNIELVFVSTTDSYSTAVDESKMEKIIDNLISNAIKYSPANSQIQIELKCDDKKWVLQVKDNGIGISKKAQKQLFKEFYRGDNAINSKVVGSGIGLLLVKNYVTMHNGSISCNSQENVGSTFQVVIPFKPISSESEIINSPSDTLIPNSPVEDLIHHTESENVVQASKEMKILIVEDNDELLNFLKSTLSLDFKVSTAVDGEKAWELISRQIPDLVVSDIMMPNMDGFELCKLMKSTYETSHIPVVLLTALSEKTDQLHGLGLGADDYLTKPFDMSLLLQRIKSIIHNREVVRGKAFKLIKGESADPVILVNEHNDKFVKNILRVARANISNAEFSKDEFASLVNMSSSLLYKKTKSLTGLSPTDFIKTIRLDHALSLLQSREYTVTEVSELCGFTSVAYFSTVFRKHFGKSPTEI